MPAKKAAPAADAAPGPGRPSKFKPEFVKQAVKLAALGATDAEIAAFFEVSDRALYRWKVEHPEFRQALNAGKAPADDRVERSLFMRAVGYSHDDVHVTSYEGKVTLTPIVKHYAPDPTSCIFWLKNRKRADWRDKPDETPDDAQAVAAAIRELIKAADAETDADT
jgi:hypothetical protein